MTRIYSEKMRVFFRLQESTIPVTCPFFDSLLKTYRISVPTQCDFTSTMFIVCLCGQKELSVQVFRFLAKSTVEKFWISFEWQAKTCIIIVASEANTCCTWQHYITMGEEIVLAAFVEYSKSDPWCSDVLVTKIGKSALFLISYFSILALRRLRKVT